MTDSMYRSANVRLHGASSAPSPPVGTTHWSSERYSGLTLWCSVPMALRFIRNPSNISRSEELRKWAANARSMLR